MSEVTIDDLLAIEPALRLIDPGAASAPGAVEVGWVVAARPTPPMLPSLRGGELVHFGQAALAAIGQPWPVLLSDLARLGAAAVILPSSIVPADLGRPDSDRAAVPVLAIAGADAPNEVEGALNRALTEFRGTLYRTGADLGRALGALTAAGADPARVVRDAAVVLGSPVRLTSTAGPVAAADPRTSPRSEPVWVERPVGGELAVAVGWDDPRRAALARLAADRLAETLAASVRRAESERPRGPARAKGIETFLFGAPPADEWQERSAAAGLGLGAATEYRVLIAPAAFSADIARAVSPLAVAVDAGAIDDAAVVLLEHRGANPNWSAMRKRLGDALENAGRAGGWAALSSPAAGFAGLRAAAEEARLVAALLRDGIVEARIAAFGDARVLGAWQLLLPIRGPLLHAFAADVLRDLPDRDRRGELRRTLEVFVATGGATVEAARQLGIHRNTLAYRIRRIAALTGLDPLAPSARLTLQLALMAARLVRTDD
jgi:PucR family transcriptional regulator, purine catabolism regulatory protein